MYKNYLKIALRNILRHKVYAGINILGLAIGMTCTILLYLYIQHEMSYDHYHKNSNRTYRIENELVFGDQSYKVPVLPARMAPHLQENYPEVELATRFRGIGNKVMRVGNRKFNEGDLYYADPNIFQIFTFKTIVGNIRQALIKPKSLVLNRSLATKLFNIPKRALGKALILDDTVSYTVTAVIENVPSNSHFKPQALISMSTYQKTKPQAFTNWRSYGCNVFLRLKPNTSPESIEKHLGAIYQKYMVDKKEAGKGKNKSKMSLIALKDIHLHTQMQSDYAEVGNLDILYIFSAIAVLILLIACANYMNLATARSIERAKEVGIRKVVGSHRRQLISQFLVEAVLMSLLAFVISLSLLELILPWFNQITDKPLKLGYTSQPQILLVFLGITLFTGLVSGSYPALVLANFKPYQVLKGRFSHSRNGNRLRQGLVVFQFSISITLIIATWVVHQQMQYVQNKDLGFDKAHTLSMRLNGQKTREKYPILKRELEKHPNVVVVSGATYRMGDGFSIDDMWLEQEGGGKVNASIKNYFVSQNYTQALGIKLTQGRSFDAARTTDYTQAVIVNETFVKKYGWKNPLGKRVSYDFDKNDKPKKVARVIGVIKDFHMFSLHKSISPMMLRLTPDKSGELGAMFIKLRPNGLSKTLKEVQAIWDNLQPNQPFVGDFIDHRFQQAYNDDQKRGQVFLSFSLIAIFIACLGLFGLASFTTRQRVKEIGIRKVLGASVPQILTLLSKNFVRLVLISSVIASPLAYYFMNKWLQGFVYRTHMPWEVFGFAAIVTMMIAVLTISFQSLRAARLNPAEVLKDE